MVDVELVSRRGKLSLEQISVEGGRGWRDATSPGRTLGLLRRGLVDPSHGLDDMGVLILEVSPRRLVRLLEVDEDSVISS